MDMSIYNGRQRAEEGIFLPLKNPYTLGPLVNIETGEEMTGEEAPGFIIQGNSAPSVQDRLKDMMKDVEETAEKEGEKAVETEMARLHKVQVDNALLRIIGARNMELDGKVVKTKAQFRKILDGTFPELGFAKDEDGNPRVRAIKGENGEDEMAPFFEITNKTFAQQVLDAAEEGARFLGVTPAT